MRLVILLLVTTLAWVEIGRTWRTRVLVLAAVLISSAILALVRRPAGRRLAILLPLLLCLAMLADYALWPAPPNVITALGLVATTAVAARLAMSEELLPSTAWRRRLGGSCLAITALSLALIGAEWLHERSRPRDPYALIPESGQGPRTLVRGDPVLVLRLQPGFRGRFVHPQYARQRATVNPDGYRGPDWPIEVDPGTKNVLLLGDSSLFGLGAEDDETIAARLEAGMAEAIPGQRFRVYNVGVPGYGPRQWQVQVERLQERLQPVLCLAMFHDTNDLQDCRLQFVASRDAGVHRERLPTETPIDGKSFHPSDVFVQPGGAGTPRLWTWLYWVRYSTLVRDLDQLAARWLVRWGWTSLTFSYNHGFVRSMRREPDLGIEEEFVLAEAAYARMDELCRARGSTFAIYRLPGLLQCEPTTFRRLLAELGVEGADFDRRLPGSRMIAWARSRGIPTLDLLPSLEVDERERCRYFYPEGHPHPRGNQRIADELLRWIRTEPRLANALVQPAPGGTAGAKGEPEPEPPPGDPRR